jgi:tyrosine aminotransferase
MVTGRLDYNKWTDIKDTFEFAQKLVDEENVLCLPGECFFKSGFVRIGIPIPLPR